MTGLNYDSLAEKTEGYSGSDLRIVCKESAMGPVRRLLDRLEGGEENISYSDLELVTVEDVDRALERVHSSVKNISEQYIRWQQEFGSQ